MELSSEELNLVCNRFRVLIIGRRNAGKTTILEKMTGSEVGAKPRIRDKEGRLVVRASLISNIDSQADGYRTTQHLSRQGWRFVESIGTSHTTNKNPSVG
jgi:GTPase SAR1 family protein